MKYFDEIYNKYFQDVYKYILAISRSSQAAEEITQETFFRALKNIDSFHGDCDIRFWLCGIAKNEYFRAMEKGKIQSSEEMPDVPSAKETEKDFIKQEDAFRIHQILHQLEEPYKEVFSLRVFGELPFKKIGLIFGKSENWARVTYYRAKQKIQKRLEDEEHE